jgi:hypothetical protein
VSCRANGSRRITGSPATYPAVHDVLTNPAYTGAFVFGRTRSEKRVNPITGAVRSRVQLLPREQWEVLIPDHHPGYIGWETYEANTARLRGNWRRARELAGGAVREGRRCYRACCGAGGAGASCSPATRAPRATAHVTCAPAPSSCMPVSTSARVSAESGWRTKSSTRFLTCSNLLR